MNYLISRKGKPIRILRITSNVVVVRDLAIYEHGKDIAVSPISDDALSDLRVETILELERLNKLYESLK